VKYPFAIDFIVPAYFPEGADFGTLQGMTIMKSAGIGLKSQHMADLLENRPTLGFLEIHAENYMGDGGAPHRWLSALAEHYPLSVHGVGLSLGGDQPLDTDHLERVARVVERYCPALVSEHLAWSSVDGNYLNDLLPIPYDEYSLAVVAEHVDQVQTRLNRRILVENPAVYVAFDSSLAEPQFLAELCRKSGCGLLLDVNNIHVSHRNVGLRIEGYLDALPAGSVGEIHLAGHHVRQIGEAEILIDDHGSPVAEAVWELYRDAAARFPAAPALIERDSNIPNLSELLAEAAKADRIRHATE
jgi:uncharacterized protein (UPF0276 family)